MLGGGRPGRRRYRRGRPRIVGRTGHGRRGRARRRAPYRCARLEDVDADEREVSRATRARAGRAASASGTHRTTNATSLGMTEALRRAAQRALVQLAAQGFEPDRIVLDGKHDYLAHAACRAHDRQGRPEGAVGRGRVGGREDDARRDDGRRGRALSRRTASSRTAAIPRRCTSARSRRTGRRSIHRRSWIFMDYCLWGGIRRFERQPRLF